MKNWTSRSVELTPKPQHACLFKLPSSGLIVAHFSSGYTRVESHKADRKPFCLHNRSTALDIHYGGYTHLQKLATSGFPFRLHFFKRKLKRTRNHACTQTLTHTYAYNTHLWRRLTVYDNENIQMYSDLLCVIIGMLQILMLLRRDKLWFILKLNFDGPSCGIGVFGSCVIVLSQKIKNHKKYLWGSEPVWLSSALSTIILVWWNLLNQNLIFKLFNCKVWKLSVKCHSLCQVWITIQTADGLILWWFDFFSSQNNFNYPIFKPFFWKCDDFGITR